MPSTGKQYSYYSAVPQAVRDKQPLLYLKYTHHPQYLEQFKYFVLQIAWTCQTFLIYEGFPLLLLPLKVIGLLLVRRGAEFSDFALMLANRKH